ncbi:hypothetical protein HPB51_005237 [Rhipicephalus microplus]|uniref:Uncharacterized protein n=1 Tax=Rhipicephalus microplus TaxID=6941 RepID=A0A9J6D8P7_RHIMP|nr:hypothetical protein HPB51_005237 [Rhipicephalus microplus]
MPGIQWQPELFGCSVRRKQGVLAVNSIFEHCQIRAEERVHFGTSAQQKLNIEYRELPPTILAFNKPTFQSGLNTRSVEKQEHRELPDNQSEDALRPVVQGDQALKRFTVRSACDQPSPEHARLGSRGPRQGHQATRHPDTNLQSRTFDDNLGKSRCAAIHPSPCLGQAVP